MIVVFPLLVVFMLSLFAAIPPSENDNPYWTRVLIIFGKGIVQIFILIIILYGGFTIIEA